MLKNLNKTIIGFDGNPIPSKPDGTGEVAMKDIIVFQLMNSDVDKPNPQEKARRWSLGLQFYKGGEQDISSDDLTLIKKLVGEAYTPAIVGPVFQWADA